MRGVEGGEGFDDEDEEERERLGRRNVEPSLRLEWIISPDPPPTLLVRTLSRGSSFVNLVGDFWLAEPVTILPVPGLLVDGRRPRVMLGKMVLICKEALRLANVELEPGERSGCDFWTMAELLRLSARDSVWRMALGAVLGGSICLT